MTGCRAAVNDASELLVVFLAMLSDLSFCIEVVLLRGAIDDVCNFKEGAESVPVW